MPTKTASRMVKLRLAKHFGITRNTLDAYLDKPGAPRPNQRGMYDVKRVGEFLNANVVSAGRSEELGTIRQRKMQLETERMQWEFARVRGEFIHKSEIAKTLVPLITEIHQALTQQFEHVLPSKYKGKSQVECQQLNVAALDEVVKRFKEGSLPLVEAASMVPINTA